MNVIHYCLQGSYNWNPKETKKYPTPRIYVYVSFPHSVQFYVESPDQLFSSFFFFREKKFEPLYYWQVAIQGQICQILTWKHLCLLPVRRAKGDGMRPGKIQTAAEQTWQRCGNDREKSNDVAWKFLFILKALSYFLYYFSFAVSISVPGKHHF